MLAESWQNYFLGEKSILGRTVRINRYPVTIVGVAPPEFRGCFRGVALDVWVPLRLAGDANSGVDGSSLEPWNKLIGKPSGWGCVTVNQQGYCDGVLLSFEGIVPQILLNVIASSIKIGTFYGSLDLGGDIVHVCVENKTRQGSWQHC